MKKLRAVATALSKALGIQGALHTHAVNRMKARHVGQKGAEKQARAARDAAHDLRTEGQKFLTFGPGENQAKGERLIRQANRKGTKARKLDVKAEKEKTRAVFWRGRARIIAKRIEGVEDNLAQIRDQIAKLGPTITGNIARGGDEFERWLLYLNTAAAHCAEGIRRNEYSMAGSWDVDHALIPGEQPGERSDCSQTQTAFMKGCGFPDINGEDFRGGFTGTFFRASDRWEKVSLEHMLKARRPAVIVYGNEPGHHTEGWCPSIDDAGDFIDPMRTVGHGSDPVDAGTVHLFGTGEVESYFILKAQ